jgi:hypothetical protein
MERVCVCEREKEREKERKGERQREGANDVGVSRCLLLSFLWEEIV